MHGEAQLLEHLADGGLFEEFSAIDVAGRKAPQAGARVDAPPSEQDSLTVAQDDRDGDLRIQVMDEAARRAGWSIAVFLQPTLERCPALQTEPEFVHASSASGSSSSRRA